MDNEDKIKYCVLPSPEIRILSFCAEHRNLERIQQKFYNASGTEFVWKTLPVFLVNSVDEFRQSYHFE